MFFRRRSPESVRAGECMAWLLMMSLRWISVVAVCIMIVGLLLNFSLHMLMTQFVPACMLLLVLNLSFVGMHRFARSMRVAYEAEADERLRNFRPLIHKPMDHDLN